jgi:hypothetical protein
LTTPGRPLAQAWRRDVLTRRCPSGTRAPDRCRPRRTSAQFQALVVNAIQTGQIPQNTSAYAGYGKIVQEVIAAAYTAFHSGLHVALYLSAGLLLAAG